ncbi:PRD domain-containing protein [Alteribacillus sp. YIM 98480]|uniref:PRD domain-containing protein n=1 Tax=Alteribacillus sp. YIM 98480 TaxID=2606599 RepID=UPI00131C21EB|nr:PRD domain-containing protein [Alteribacillus sp. YIM 98480]
MVIQKVLNHNAAIVLHNEEEKVAIGSGLAFQKKKHDKINPEKVEKLFVHNPNSQTPFVHLLALTENGDTKLVQEIVSWLEQKHEKHFDSHSYALFFDHLVHLMKRLKQDKKINNHLLQEIKTLYPDAFELAQKTAKKIEIYVNKDVAQDEIGFLALHLYKSTKKKMSPQILKEHTEALHYMVNIMEEELNTIFPKNTIAYEGLISHLHVTVKAAEVEEELTKAPAELIEMMKMGYPKAFRAAEMAVSAFENRYRLSLPEDESVYIAMHTQRLVSRRTN